MANITIVFGALLTVLGLYGYFGSTADSPSVTALIPAFFGVPLEICGILAMKDSLRKHAMHGAVMIALLGALAAGGRGLMKIGALFSNDPDVNKRPVVMMLLMAVICAVFVVLCVRSFINVRREREQREAAGDSATESE